MLDVPWGWWSEYVNPYIYSHKSLKKIRVDMWNHQADCLFYLWLAIDVWSGDMQAQKRVWLYMIPNILSETGIIKKH